MVLLSGGKDQIQVQLNVPNKEIKVLFFLKKNRYWAGILQSLFPKDVFLSLPHEDKQPREGWRLVSGCTGVQDTIPVLWSISRDTVKDLQMEQSFLSTRAGDLERYFLSCHACP